MDDSSHRSGEPSDPNDAQYAATTIFAPSGHASEHSPAPTLMSPFRSVENNLQPIASQHMSPPNIIAAHTALQHARNHNSYGMFSASGPHHDYQIPLNGNATNYSRAASDLGLCRSTSLEDALRFNLQYQPRSILQATSIPFTSLHNPYNFNTWQSTLGNHQIPFGAYRALYGNDPTRNNNYQHPLSTGNPRYVGPPGSNALHPGLQPLRVAQLRAEATGSHQNLPVKDNSTLSTSKVDQLPDQSPAKTPEDLQENEDIFRDDRFPEDEPENHKPKPETVQGDTEDEDDGDDAENESIKRFKQRLTNWIRQMMFVSGESAEPSPETTWMIEEIVREQVVEMLKEASILANRRGSKSISIVDLIFQIRHNQAKVSRLKTFLSWKDVRKNVKDSDDKAGGGDADALDLEDTGPMGANPAAPQKTQANKKAKLILPWEVQSYFSETVPEREDEEDEEEEEQNEATLARLASADERTKNMTKDEYVVWSDCRQASFTFRKGKRFREWAGFGTIIDSKPNDDVVDILGFLTFEIVQTLTEEALKVKNAEDLANKKAGRGDLEASKKRKREVCSLFEMPEEGRTPVEPRHVQEAFRRLQIVPNKYKYMRHGRAGIRTPLRMI